MQRIRDLCAVSLKAASARAKVLAEFERREAERFRLMALETRLRELEQKQLRLDALQKFLASQNR